MDVKYTGFIPENIAPPGAKKFKLVNSLGILLMTQRQLIFNVH